MMKKSLLLSISLLACTLFATQEETIEKTQQDDIFLMEQLYQSITQSYNQKEITTLEKNIEKEINTYVKNSIDKKEHAKKTQDIEKEVDKLLTYLISKSNTDEAFAVASMMFMIKWSKFVTKEASQLQDPNKIENLQEATEVIKDFVEKKFLDPMAKRIEEEGKA